MPLFVTIFYYSKARASIFIDVRMYVCRFVREWCMDQCGAAGTSVQVDMVRSALTVLWILSVQLWQERAKQNTRRRVPPCIESTVETNKIMEYIGKIKLKWSLFYVWITSNLHMNIRLIVMHIHIHMYMFKKKCRWVRIETTYQYYQDSKSPLTNK